MATTTSTSTANVLQSQVASSFIRKSNIVLQVSNSRPGTNLNVYFDGVLVNQHCGLAVAGLTPSDVGQAQITDLTTTLGQPLTANSSGAAVIVFSIPPNTFNVGEREVIVTDAPGLDYLDQNSLDTSFGYCRAIYTATGTISTWQQVTTTTVTTSQEIVLTGKLRRRRDPLAQSFFTEGVKGGLFLTAIEVFFLTKSANETEPVIMDIRKMVNGFPGEQEEGSDTVSVVEASKITGNSVDSIKAGQGIGTKFRFNPPLYLKENGDYCFVLSSNSANYYVYRSELGAIAYENDKKIDKNPFIGTMFKSENNYTWTPEQKMDIKFNIYKAEFSTQGDSLVTLMAEDMYTNVSGTRFTLLARSPSDDIGKIAYSSPVKHGITSAGTEYITVIANTAGTYRGITGNKLTGDFLVSEVIDEYKLIFNVPGLTGITTTAGTLKTAGTITSVRISDPGTGYSGVASKTLTFAGGGGSGAAGNVVIQNDKAVKTILSSGGSGYTSAPILSIAGNATFKATASIDASFRVTTNTPFSIVSPRILGNAVEDSTMDTTIRTYSMAGSGSYTLTPEADTLPFYNVTKFNEEKLLVNSKNSAVKIAGASSINVDVRMRTNNANVSPVLDLRQGSALSVSSFRINNQHDNEETATTGVLSRIVVTNPGSGYSSTPTVTFTNHPNDTSGSGAVATVEMAGIAPNQTVKSIAINNAGSGYLFPPTITFSSGNAEAECQLNISAQNGSLSTISWSGGTGYASAPTATVVPAPNDFTGHGAVLSTTILGGAVNLVKIENAGSGYMYPPKIVFSGGTPSTPASASCTLTKFNSETGGAGNPSGNAYSRYLTKKFTLSTISSGIRVISQIASTAATSVDVYVRISLTGNNVTHTDQKWIMLKCDVSRNKSNSYNEFWEYTFYYDELPPFDVYDLKFVLSSSNVAHTPTVANYRAIIVV